jgi:ubiquinone/menaquinone biosynthesis C-methylase UbiE
MKETFQPEPSICEGETDEEVFRSYMEDLDLKPEDFKGKILDVGAGTAQFAKWARDHHVSDQIYSLDERGDRLHKEKSVVGRAEQLPFADNSFDLIVSDGAIPNVVFSVEGIVQSLLEMWRVIKPGHEIRLARVLNGYKLLPHIIVNEGMSKALDLLEAKGATVKMKHLAYADVYNTDNTDLISESYLVIIRKPE